MRWLSAGCERWNNLLQSEPDVKPGMKESPKKARTGRDRRLAPLFPRRMCAVNLRRSFRRLRRLVRAAEIHFRQKTPSRLLFPYLRSILLDIFFLKTGEMAERSKAAVSKTVNGIFPFGGSNPPLSAIFCARIPGFFSAFPVFPLFPKKTPSICFFSVIAVPPRITPFCRPNDVCASHSPTPFAS